MTHATSTELVLAERRDPVLVLTLNRPERLNAWTDALEVQRDHPITHHVAGPEPTRVVEMYSNLKRLVVVAAVGAIGILAPVATASAASTPTRASLASALAPDSFDFIGPSVAPGAFAVIGPTVYTVGAGNVFTGTTITTTAGGAVVATGPAG